MPKVTVTPVTSIVGNESSAVGRINANFEALRDEFDNVVSRDGETPSDLEADLDLNNHDILNVKTLYAQDVSATDAVFGDDVEIYGDLLVQGTLTVTDFETQVTTVIDTLQNDGLRIFDTGGDHYYTVSPSEDATQNRVLSLNLNDGDRSLSLEGDTALNQDLTTDAAPTFDTLTLTTSVITDNSAVAVDGSPNSGEYAKFTANGLEGRTAAEARSDLDLLTATTLASTSNGDGAALIGVEDSGGKFSATTVEGVLQEIGEFPSLDLLYNTALSARRRVETRYGFGDILTTLAGVTTGSSSNYFYVSQNKTITNLVKVQTYGDGYGESNRSDSSGWTDLNIRQWLGADLFSEDATHIRLFVYGPLGEPTIFESIYIGHADASNPEDFDSAPTQVTFEGSGGNQSTGPWTLQGPIGAIGGDYKPSGLIEFAYDSTKDLLISHKVDSSTDDILLSSTANTDRVIYWGGSGADQSSTTAVSGYSTTANRLVTFLGIELWAPKAMVLVFGAKTVSGTPSSARTLVRAKLNGGTINTDLIAAVSRDSGSNWENATLVSLYTDENGFGVYEGLGIDLSGQISGSDLSLRLTTTDDYVIEIDSVVLEEVY